MKKFRILALALVTMLLLAACGGTAPAADSGSTAPAADLGVTVEDGVLKVGMECAYAPFNWTQLDDSNDAVALADGTFAGGYDVEIAKLLAEHMGYELEIVKTEWDGLPPSLTSGKIDAIIAGMTDTEERRQTIDFTEQYYVSDLVIVVDKEGEYTDATSLEDFAGAKITGQQATLHYEVVEQIPDVVQEQAMKDFPTMVVALASGKIDGYVSERPGALSAVASNPNLTFIEFEDGNGFDYTQGDVSVSIGIRKGNAELEELINAALASISEEDRGKLMEQAVLDQPLSAEE